MSNTVPSYSDPARTFHPGAPSINSGSDAASTAGVAGRGVPQPPQRYEGGYQQQQQPQQYQQQYEQQNPSFTQTSSNGLVHEEAHYTHPEQLAETHRQIVPGLGDNVPVHTLNRHSSTASNLAPPPQHPTHQPSQTQINTPTFAPTNPQPNYAPPSINTDLNRSPPPQPPRSPEQPTIAVVNGPALTTPGQILHERNAVSPISPRASVESSVSRTGHLGPSGAQAGQLFPISAFAIKQSGAYSSHLVVNWRTVDGRAGQTERLGPSLGLGLAIRSLRNKGIPEGAHIQAYMDVTLGKGCLAPETFIYQELAPTTALYSSGGTTLSKDKLTLIYGDE